MTTAPEVASSTSRLDRAATAVTAYVVLRTAGVLALVVAAASADRSGLRILTRWDGGWYAGIATRGYGTTMRHPDGRLLADYAFFPLLPTLERAVATLTGLTPLAAGLLLAWTVAPVAALGIHRVVAAVADRRTATITVLLWACLPVAVVQTMAYTESLFTALAAWALVALLRRHWVAASLLAAAAALTRPTGVAVTLAVLVAIAASVRAEGRIDARRVASALVAVAGSIAFPLWVALDVGSPLGYFEVTAGWGNGLDGGAAFAAWILGFLVDPATVALGLLVLVGVAALVALLVACVRMRLPAPLLAYAGTLLVLAFATSGYFGSKPRYLVPAFVLLVPVAHWLAGRGRRTQAVVLTVAAVTSLAYGTIWLLGPGPP